MAKEEPAHVLAIDGREVRISNPSKLYFSRERRLTKLELVQYYLSVADGALRGIRDRPVVLKRFVNGAEGEAFYQKRAPENHPAWLRTVTLRFPSGRTAEELVVDDPAGLAWIVNLGCIELHPHPVRSDALEHPDELRVDLDPTPGTSWDQVRRVALEVKALFDEHGLASWPKTSGSRGMHIYVRIQPRWSFTEVRRAALAISREIERRAPTLATSKWWKEERHGVFLDYNQNAKDRTTCSAYSVRPLPDARVSTPLRLGRGAQTASRPTSPWRRCPRAWRSSAIRTRRSTRWRRRSSRCSSWRRATRRRASATRPGRRTTGRWRARRRGSRRPRKKGAAAAKKTPRVKLPLLTIANSPSKEAALAGLERWKARHPEVAARLAVEDVLVDSMRGRSSTWTRIRVNLKNVPEARAPARRRRPTRTTIRRASGARSGSAAKGASCEDRRQLVRRHDLELRVGAVARLLVRPPAPELRDVPEAGALHVVVADLGHELRAQRLPGETLARAPAAARARPALHARLAPRGPPSPSTGGSRARSRGTARGTRPARGASRR